MVLIVTLGKMNSEKAREREYYANLVNQLCSNVILVFHHTQTMRVYWQNVMQYRYGAYCTGALILIAENIVDVYKSSVS